MASVTIVVPCTTKRSPQCASVKMFSHERFRLRFIFVDDGSTDDTWSGLENLRAGDIERFLTRPLSCNVGKGEAVRQGLLQAFEANPDYVVIGTLIWQRL